MFFWSSDAGQRCFGVLKLERWIEVVALDGWVVGAFSQARDVMEFFLYQ